MASGTGSEISEKTKCEAKRRSTAASLSDGSVVILRVSNCFGIVVTLSRLATQRRGSPSALPSETSLGMLRMRVETGATVTSARTS